MAQTTPDASFGPIFVVAGLPVEFFVEYIYIYKKVLVSI
jgi:hypothetical protein